jgi:hypothetical protein
MRLRPAVLDDLPFIMATERRPGYEGRVGRWTEAEHRTGLAASGTAYLIGETEGPPRLSQMRLHGGGYGPCRASACRWRPHRSRRHVASAARVERSNQRSDKITKVFIRS